MSLSLIAFQPAIEEPSNMKPSLSWSSSTAPEHIDRCCHLPLGSVNRRSTHSISSSLIRLKILPASLMLIPCCYLFPGESRGPVEGLRRLTPAFAGELRHRIRKC